MTTPRLTPVPPTKASPLTRLMYRYAKRRFGEVPEPFGALVQRGSTVLPTAVRELAVYWTARPVGCSWCVDFGAMLSRLEGLNPQKLTAIDDYQTSPVFTDDERAAIAYADAVTTDPHTVTDEQVADLRRRFGDDGVVELTYQIGLENMRARMNAALGITEQGFGAGESCRVPWAQA